MAVTRDAAGSSHWWTAVPFAVLLLWFVAVSVGHAEPATRPSSTSGTIVPGDTTSGVTSTTPVTPPVTPSLGASPAAGASRPLGNADRVDPDWTHEVAVRTGIPPRALAGYGGAELAIADEAPGCRLRWSMLAALGGLESGHGTHAGSVLDETGTARPAILGPDLDGTAYDRIDDTDRGVLDGSDRVDRATGPMQFIPSTWQAWGADGNGDATADPQQIDDASLAAGRYLCSHGDLADPATWRRAVLAYNHVDSYADSVTDAAAAYAELAHG